MSSYNDKNSKIPDFFLKCALKTWDMLLEKTKYTRNDFYCITNRLLLMIMLYFFKQVSKCGVNYV